MGVLGGGFGAVAGTRDMQIMERKCTVGGKKNMRKCVNKKLTALFLTAVMGGSLCADMTVFAEETTDQEVIISETQGEEDTASEEENQVEAEPESDESENPLEELPEMTPNEEVGNVQVENENNELEEKPIAAQSNGISLQSIEGVCGENLTWSLDETTGTLTISGSGEMDFGDLIDSPWYEQDEKIKKVILGKGVTSIEGGAFQGCRSLESINIPNSVTTIEGTAFMDCSSLKNISIPNSVTYIGPATFAFCSSLESIKIPDRVTFLDGAAEFEGCTSLKTVILPANMEVINRRMFQDCRSLESISIPESVKHLYFLAFMGCSSLKSVKLPSSLSDIGCGAFHGCSKLSELTIPKSVSEIEEYIYGYYGDEPSNNDDEPQNLQKYPNVKIKCYTNTAGHKYAKDNGIAYELLDGTSQTKVKVTGIKISGISKKIAAGKKIKLTVKVSPSNATNKSVKWTSSNKKVATVNSKGVVTINKKAGGKSVTITAAATDGSKKKATYKISVMKGVVKKVTISGNKPVKAGKTLKLKAKVTATKKANKKLKWTSSNKKYATVSSSGKVKTYKAGKKKKVKITAEATDGSGKKKTVTIKIK